MYKNPSARVRTNGILSRPFYLHRGTRQGCPLSPGLFALAIEPLALLVRSGVAGGMVVGQLTEKLSLYTDNALLYLPDASTSLEEALWVLLSSPNKLPTVPLASPLLAHIPLQVVTKIRKTCPHT